MKHIKYSLQDWLEAKRKAKHRAMLLGIKQGLKKHNTPNAKKLLKVINKQNT